MKQARSISIAAFLAAALAPSDGAADRWRISELQGGVGCLDPAATIQLKTAAQSGGFMQAFGALIAQGRCVILPLGEELAYVRSAEQEAKGFFVLRRSSGEEVYVDQDFLEYVAD